jgi:hypothetical protein
MYSNGIFSRLLVLIETHDIESNFIKGIEFVAAALTVFDILW